MRRKPPEAAQRQYALALVGGGDAPLEAVLADLWERWGGNPEEYLGWPADLVLRWLKFGDIKRTMLHPEASDG